MTSNQATFELRRRRVWIVAVRKARQGWEYTATPDGYQDDQLHAMELTGWTCGGRRDALDEAQQHIDSVDGRPDGFCRRPYQVC